MELCAVAKEIAMSDLLDLALDGHGGLERWRRLETVTASMTVSGALFAFKGHPAGLGQVTVAADTTTPFATFTPFPSADRALFEFDRVAVTRGDSEHERVDPRAACLDVGFDAPWDDLHLLYFVGYAVWNYLCTPFLLTWPDFVVDEIDPWQEGSETWRRLRVTFPPQVPTHNAEQVLYIDDAGLLRRLDYAPDILGSRPAAHYCHDHRDVEGLVVPTRRRVYGRRDDGTPDTSLAVVEIDISDVSVT
jgi:hypothetical protein